ncbi:hypothetical protein [Serinicoccus sp. CUA-874]|uniref:hypothetical protein n=1 Tax=Serinicoccus sp. CUA-874 TaxID=1517939 RepID=UPI001179CC8C|nr:hypothetical protein [Serinicoccus sp. CUA-874]
MDGPRAPRHGRRWAASASSVVVTAALASCGMPSTTAGGDAATWTVTRARNRPRTGRSCTWL